MDPVDLYFLKAVERFLIASEQWGFHHMGDEEKNLCEVFLNGIAIREALAIMEIKLL